MVIYRAHNISLYDYGIIIYRMNVPNMKTIAYMDRFINDIVHLYWKQIIEYVFKEILQIRVEVSMSHTALTFKFKQEG